MIGRESLGIEAVKWLAFALMVLDHVTIFLTAERPVWAYLLGRLVFPLFAMSLAHGLRNSGELAIEGCARRLLLWGVVAQVPYSLLIPDVMLNVLFTFWAGLFLYACVRFNRWNWSRFLLAALAVLISGVVEFGPVGVMFVVCAVGYERAKAFAATYEVEEPALSKWPLRAWLAGFWITLTLLHAVNGVPVAMLAPLVFWAVVKWVELPRIRHAFYWLYPAQFAAIAAARAVL